jgi:hypothetical protein
LQQQSNHAFALYFQGLIALRIGTPQLATELIEKAIEFNENVALSHGNLTEICRQPKRLDDVS